MDTDGSTWLNGAYQIQFVPNPTVPGLQNYHWQGGNLQANAQFSGPLSGTGTFSVSIPRSSAITPAGSAWNVTICPFATSGCVSVQISTSAATQDLTSQLNAIAAGPRFADTNVAYGYNTINVFPLPKPGMIFFNVTNNTCNQWNGSAWQSCNGGLTSGCVGSVPGDNSSTNCGFNNRVPDTATTPASVSTFGANNLDTNSAQNAVAVGNSNGANNIGNDQIFIGHSNWINSTVTAPNTNNNIALGNDNFDTNVGSQVAENICIGHANCNNGGYFAETVSIGNANNTGNNGGSPSTNLNEAVMIGLANGQNIQAGTAVVAIGNTTCGGDPAGFGGNNDAICIGDEAGFLLRQNSEATIAIGVASATQLGANSFDITAIGDGAMKQCTQSSSGCAALTFPFPSSNVSGVLAIGGGAAQYNQGSNVIAMGEFSLGPSAFLVSHTPFIYNQGNDIVAIGGQFALAANTTGSKNVALGSYAGSDGYTGSVIGNSNLTGSNNTWLGYDSGPNTTSQLSNTVAIGYQSHVGASNTVTIGNSSMTNNTVYNALTVSAGGTGVMTLGPGLFASLPACAGGTEGSIAPVTDSNTAVWGATISGLSTNHVLAYCDGTNWTVMAK